MTGRKSRSPRTRDAAAAVDDALQTLRRDGGPLLALWLLAWAPQVAAAWWLIDAVAARDEPALAGRAALFTLAMPWRWAVTAWLQARAMRRRGVAVKGGAAAWFATLEVVRVRVLASAVGGALAVLVVPTLWMLYASAFAGPRVLAVAGEDGVRREEGLLGAGAAAVRDTRSLTRHALLVSLLTGVGGVVLLASFGSGLYLLQAWLNVELATAVQVWSTPVFAMAACLLVWMLWDLMTALSAVPLLARLEARSGGGDLGRRIEAAAAAASGERERAA